MISLDYTVVYQIILFVVLWLVLTRILFRPYLALLEERERRTAGTQHESAELAHESERLRAQFEERIAQAQAVGTAAKESLLQQARREREQLISQAREEATRTLEQARAEIQRQMEKEKQLATAEVNVIAREMAHKILGRSVGDFLKSRRADVLATVEEAAERKRRAEALVREYKGRLMRLDQEVQSIQELLRADGEREKSKLLREAETTAAKIKDDARFLADQEVKIAADPRRDRQASHR
jgi:F-type H+-transporting ATPase subunit b